MLTGTGAPGHGARRGHARITGPGRAWTSPARRSAVPRTSMSAPAQRSSSTRAREAVDRLGAGAWASGRAGRAEPAPARLRRRRHRCPDDSGRGVAARGCGTFASRTCTACTSGAARGMPLGRPSGAQQRTRRSHRLQRRSAATAGTDMPEAPHYTFRRLTRPVRRPLRRFSQEFVCTKAMMRNPRLVIARDRVPRFSEYSQVNRTNLLTSHFYNIVYTGHFRRKRPANPGGRLAGSEMGTDDFPGTRRTPIGQRGVAGWEDQEALVADVTRSGTRVYRCGGRAVDGAEEVADRSSAEEDAERQLPAPGSC